MSIEDLNWWLALAQTDLETNRESTNRRLISELDNRLNDPSVNAVWNAERVNPRDFGILVRYMKEQIEAMRRGDVVGGHFITQASWNGAGLDEGKIGSAETWIDTNGKSLKHTCMGLFIKAWKEADLNIEQIKTCPAPAPTDDNKDATCEKIFIQAGAREKKYCSVNCRNRAYKPKPEEE